MTALLVGLIAAVLAQGGQPAPIKHEVAAQGSVSRLKTPHTFVLRDAKSFAEYWNAHLGRNPFEELEKPIDWGSEMLVAIHLGERRSGGFGPKVESITKVKAGEYKVAWSEKVPGPREMVTMMITQPWVIVRMPRVEGKIAFERKAEPGKRTKGG